jgi:hypothetical protein
MSCVAHDGTIAAIKVQPQGHETSHGAEPNNDIGRGVPSEYIRCGHA